MSQFIFVSFRSEARNLVFNKFNTLRFLTYVRNDIFSNCDTVSEPEVVQGLLSALGKLLPNFMRTKS